MLRGVAVLTCPACGSTWDAAARVGAHCPDCGTWTRLRPQPGASQARGPSASVQPSAEGEDAATPEAGMEGAATTPEPATVTPDEPTPPSSEVPATEGTDAPPSPPRTESSPEPPVPPLLVRERGVKKREPVQKPTPPRTVKVQEAPRGEPKIQPAIPPEAHLRQRHTALDVLESRGIWSFRRK
jgi:hypothetical protein